MAMKRRNFLKGTLAGSAVAVGASMFPHALFAEWPQAAFEAKDFGAAMQALLGSTEAAESADITVKAPDIAENGSVVPVEVSSTIANIESISIIVEKNPVPLIASFKFPDPTIAEGYVSTRIKMGATSNVIAVVQAGGKLFKAAKEVKVTIGGCGG
jgi:sulfur-oxidizing protein SoxY